jgi:hypothetical protein
MTTALFDLIDGEVVVAEDKPRPAVDREQSVPKVSHVDRNAAYLEEHLIFAVPLRMRELEHTMKQRPKVLSGEHTWQQALLVWFRHAEAPRPAFSNDTPANTDVTAQIATQGDLLLSVEGQHRNAGTVAAALVTGLATGALINPDGITYRGLHWCVDHCPRPVRKPPPEAWKQEFDAILDDLLEKL